MVPRIILQELLHLPTIGNRRKGYLKIKISSKWEQEIGRFGAPDLCHLGISVKNLVICDKTVQSENDPSPT